MLVKIAAANWVMRAVTKKQIILKSGTYQQGKYFSSYTTS